MAFKLVPKGRVRSSASKPPRVSITFPGRLNFTTAAVEILTRDYAYDYVLLYWDDERSVMAIRPSRKKDDRAFKVLYNKTGRNVSVQAKSFFDYIGYDCRRARSFPMKWNEVEGAFDVDLRDGERSQSKTVPIARSVSSETHKFVNALDLAGWYTRAEVCERLRISRSTFDRIVRDHGIEKQFRPRPGKRAEIVFNPSDIDVPELYRKNRSA
jgi:hypothetical protein